MLGLADKAFKSSYYTSKKLKEIMLKEVKEGMTVSHQIDDIPKERNDKKEPNKNPVS